MVYIAVSFSHTPAGEWEILVALLAEMGYEGFEEDDDTLHAFIPEMRFEPEQLKALSDDRQVVYTVVRLPETNWNKVWESNFQPVTVGRFCHIRADFHQPLPGFTYEILITPKMSFGTGHHATTHMMIRQMEDLSFSDKSVLDFGTGTGLLAILSEKMGAARIIAIDNDERSIYNAQENFQRNNVGRILLRQAGDAHTGETFHIILANIIRQVILDNFEFFIAGLAPGGVLLLSGLLADDEEAVLEQAKKADLLLEKKLEQDGWLCLRFRR